jgi:hypothetical protein
VNLHQFPLEVLLASGYAIFLLCVAAALEKLAIHAHRRAARYELAGFRYYPNFDRWECPEGNHLLRIETDHLRKIVRYRAPAQICNTCAKKNECTDSEEGREVEHRLDLWLETGLHHFHQGISLALIVLAATILLVEAVRFAQPAIRSLLGALLLATTVVGARSCASFGSAGTRSVEPK